MTLADQKLQAIADQLTKGIAPPRESLRSFLLWFGAARRGFRIVREIRGSLKKHGLLTIPDFEYPYIDCLISFKASTDEQGDTASAIPDYSPTYCA